MAARSLNKVMLIGNLTRDPELRYTPQGTPVCTIGLATNRAWTDSGNQKQESTEFHRIVAWNKLAELCSQLLFKGRKVYFEGRLQTRNWTGQDGQERQTVEIIASDMIVLDSKRKEGEEYTPAEPKAVNEPEVMAEPPATDVSTMSDSKTDVSDTTKDEKNKKSATKKIEKDEKEELSADDIPF